MGAPGKDDLKFFALCARANLSEAAGPLPGSNQTVPSPRLTAFTNNSPRRAVQRLALSPIPHFYKGTPKMGSLYVFMNL